MAEWEDMNKFPTKDMMKFQYLDKNKITSFPGQETIIIYSNSNDEKGLYEIFQQYRKYKMFMSMEQKTQLYVLLQLTNGN